MALKKVTFAERTQIWLFLSIYFFISFSYSVGVRRLTEPASFYQYAGVVPPQPAPGPVPEPAPVPQPAPIPQQAQMTPKRTLALKPDPAEVVHVVPSGSEHLQRVLDQGTGFRLLSFDAMSNDQLQMVPTARAGMELHVSTPNKSKIIEGQYVDLASLLQHPARSDVFFLLTSLYLAAHPDQIMEKKLEYFNSIRTATKRHLSSGWKS